MASAYQNYNSSKEDSLDITYWVLGNIIYKKDCRRAPVKCFYDRSERLLPCSVPNLHLYLSIFVNAYNFGVKLHSQSGSISLFVNIFRESVQKTTFSHSRRSDDYHFEGFILFFHLLEKMHNDNVKIWLSFLSLRDLIIWGIFKKVSEKLKH